MPRNYRQGITLEQAFAILEGVAASGARCPVSRVNGLTSQLTSELARTGKIRIDVYPHNYRVVTILDGPNAGKSTKAPPIPDWKPYLTIEKDSPARSTNDYRGISP